jgi:hypothetical protein
MEIINPCRDRYRINVIIGRIEAASSFFRIITLKNIVYIILIRASEFPMINLIACQKNFAKRFSYGYTKIKIFYSSCRKP